MAFKPLETAGYPVRQWVILGPPNVGKSTFTTQMRTPILPIDADHRYKEVAKKVKGKVFDFSDEGTDHSDPERIAEILDQNMPRSGIQTIVIDSLTAIMSPYVNHALLDNKNGVHKNNSAAFQEKASMMRCIQDSVTRHGVDNVWIWHIQETSFNGETKLKETIPATEYKRLMRSLNMKIELFQDEKSKKRGARILWSRGNMGGVVWDEKGNWEGVPERLEEMVYGNIDRNDHMFTSKEDALEFSVKSGAFDNLEEAIVRWEELKKEHSPKSSLIMFNLWLEEVERRKQNKEMV